MWSVTCATLCVPGGRSNTDVVCSLYGEEHTCPLCLCSQRESGTFTLIRGSKSPSVQFPWLSWRGCFQGITPCSFSRRARLLGFGAAGFPLQVLSPCVKAHVVSKGCGRLSPSCVRCLCSPITLYSARHPAGSRPKLWRCSDSMSTS